MLSLYFGLGVIIQIALLARNKLNFRKNFLGLFLVSAVSSLAFIPHESLHTYNFNTRIFLFFILFSIFFILIFKEQILPTVSISKQTLVILTLAFWYIALTGASISAIFRNVLFLTALIPTIAVISIAILNITPNLFWKLFICFWFAVSAVFIVLKQPILTNTASFFEMIIIGMLFLYLSVNTWLAIQYIFISNSKTALDRWNTNIKKKIEKHFTNNINPAYPILIILVKAMIFAVNYYYKFIPDNLLIGIFILFIPQIISFLHFQHKDFIFSNKKQHIHFFGEV